MADIEKTLQKAEGVATQAQAPDTSTLWKLVLGAVVGLVVWYLKWKLSSQARELAELKTQKEQAEIDAQAAKVRSQVDSLDAATLHAKATAIYATAVAQMLGDEIKALQIKHDDQVERVSKLETWDDVNKASGVK